MGLWRKFFPVVHAAPASAPTGATAADGEQHPRDVGKSEGHAIVAAHMQDYPETYYTQTVKEAVPALQSLDDTVDVDACVVGGGLAGIATALGLLDRGRTVVLLERDRIGGAASGMNGGFVIPGFAVENDELIEMLGEEQASRLYGWSVDALTTMKQRVKKFAIDCDLDHCGMVSLSCFKNREEEDIEFAKHHNHVFGTKMEVWPAAKVRALYHSEFYHHAVFDPIVHTVHPLNYTLGLARATAQQGGLIYENTRAVRVAPGEGKRRWRVETASKSGGVGAVLADDVVLAGGSSLDSAIEPRVAHALVPLLTYIMVTEPLGDRLDKAFTPPHCVVDDRFSLNYYRRLKDGRLLWGGFATSFPIAAGRLRARMTKDLAEVYPQLGDARADAVWGGPVTYGYHFMPMIGQRAPGFWYCTGFGGHGIVPTQMAGDIVAAGIADNDQRWRLLAELFPLKYVGWPATQVFGTLGYWWFRARDWSALTWQRWGW